MAHLWRGPWRTRGTPMAHPWQTRGAIYATTHEVSVSRHSQFDYSIGKLNNEAKATRGGNESLSNEDEAKKKRDLGSPMNDIATCGTIHGAHLWRGPWRRAAENDSSPPNPWHIGAAPTPPHPPFKMYRGHHTRSHSTINGRNQLLQAVSEGARRGQSNTTHLTEW